MLLVRWHLFGYLKEPLRSGLKSILSGASKKETCLVAFSPLLKHLEIDWWQVVAFAEAGRVAPKYSAELFIKDLKWDVGLSFRVMAYRMPLRLDWAVSEEG